MNSFILAEKLKEEMNGRRIKAAVFHSFNFDSEFFENYLLPLFLPEIPFGDNKIQNTLLWKRFQRELPPITVYCDFHAKSEKGIHLDYLVRPIDLSRIQGIKPCFHPKHTYILLEDDELIVITGSNNLTEAGWCSNLEGVNFFKLRSGVYFPRDFKDGLRDINHQITTLLDETILPDIATSEADVLLKSFFYKQKYKGNSNTRCISSYTRWHDGNLGFRAFLDHLRYTYNKNKAFKKIEVVSPYFPKSISLFDDLIEVSECEDVSISIPYENNNLVAMEQLLFEEVSDLNITWKSIKGTQAQKGYRFNHSKIYQFQGDDCVILVVGSFNFTNTAWKGIKNGGNFESAILYKLAVDAFNSLLEDAPPFEILTFSGHREEENKQDRREDAYHLQFIIDWSAQTIEIINYQPKQQRGKIVFDNDSDILINESGIRKLTKVQLNEFSENPIVKVRPSNKEFFFYYHPIHKNIGSKPLPAHINLSDGELLQLWAALDEENSTTVLLSIIDSFITRITDEAGEVNDEEMATTASTLNVMSTHLNGLLKLQKKIFKEGRTKLEKKKYEQMRDYYLCDNSGDTLLGYRKLIEKAHAEERINSGFYWLLLNCIDKLFYDEAVRPPFNFSKEKIDIVQKTLSKCISEITSHIKTDKLTQRHLNWTLKELTK